ncbi:MAG: chemotaxis protein CheW [Idiomarina sp.]|nr:chemotaxis protein CheW [Idiomarina sp.]
MSQNSSSDRAMREYLTALLEEEAPADLSPLAKGPVEKLLENAPVEEELVTEKSQGINVPEDKVVAAPSVTREPVVRASVKPEPDVAPPELKKDLPPAPPDFPDAMAEYREEPFQALFFRVAGLNLAVPLKSLGGIHKWAKPKPLFGKPKWYLGIMPHREEQLNAVDSARWVMPDKYTKELAESLDYQYLVMLNESSWGLACEELVNTDTLDPEEVQWRTAGGKRPWLAGIVKEKMCALINVDALITLLEQGLDNSEKGTEEDPVS